jgi:ASC-1-like (ASCH) protein
MIAGEEYRKIHRIKIEQQYAAKIVDGSKKFEIRFNDRNYQPGDAIEMKVDFDDDDLKLKIFAEIGYVSNYRQILGYVVFTLINPTFFGDRVALSKLKNLERLITFSEPKNQEKSQNERLNSATEQL